MAAMRQSGLVPVSGRYAVLSGFRAGQSLLDSELFVGPAKKSTAPEPMKNLANSIMMAGSNFWDAPGDSMAGSNDLPTRREIFPWIEKNENALYSPRIPIHSVGVYFSPKSRDYTAKNSFPLIEGTLVLLIQQHQPLEVVTPRTLEEFHGQTLVLPHVSTLDETDRQALKAFVDQDGWLVILGQDASGLPQSDSKIVLSDDPGGAISRRWRMILLPARRILPRNCSTQ